MDAGENISEHVLRRYMDPVIEQALIELAAVKADFEFSIINISDGKSQQIQHRLKLIADSLIMLSLGRASRIIHSGMQKIPDILPASRFGVINHESARIFLEVIEGMSQYLDGLRQEHVQQENLLPFLEEKILQLNNLALTQASPASEPQDQAVPSLKSSWQDDMKITQKESASIVSPIPIQGRAGLDIELRRDFLRTADRNLKAGNMVLGLLVKSPGSSVLSREFLKILDTLKSSALTGGLSEIVELCHSMEMLVNVLNSGDAQYADEMKELLTQSYAQLTAIVEQYIHHRAMTPVEELVLQINKHLLKPANDVMIDASQENEQRYPRTHREIVYKRPDKQYLTTVEKNARQPEAPVAEDKQNSLSVHMTKLGELQSLIDETFSLLRSYLDEMKGEIDLLQDHLSQERALTLSGEGSLDNGDSGGDEEVLYQYVDEYHRLHDQGLQLLDSMSEHVSQRQQVIAALHAGLRQQRMATVSSQMKSFDALIKNIAEQCSKSVTFNISGGQISLDRALLKNLIVPLQYLVRYDIEHGIEDSALRVKSGKPETGSVSLEFARKNANLVIKVIDDGAGIDLNKVREAAVTLGYIESADGMTDREAAALVLNPAFDNESNNPELQTQGVRLSELALIIKSMGGSLSLISAVGAGNIFTIDVPCEWDVIRVLMTQVGQEVYALPSACVDNVVYLQAEEIEAIKLHKNYQYENNGRYYQFRELDMVLGIAQALRKAEDIQYPVVLIRMGNKRMALQVDQIKGQREIIINQPVPELNRVKVISSATLLGDGRLVLVLELGALLGEDVGKLKAIRELTMDQD